MNGRWSSVVVLIVGIRVLGFKPQCLVWTGGELQMECPLTVQLLRKAGDYVKENVVAVKAVSYKDNIFLLTPRTNPISKGMTLFETGRYKRGVPATVCKLTRYMSDDRVALSPYPDLALHAEGDCTAIQNAVDFHLDHLGMLWVLDSGTVDTMANARCTCPPKLVALDLNRDELAIIIDLSHVVEDNSVLSELVIEYSFEAKPFAYITDLSQGSIIVYDINTRTGYRLLLPLPACRLQMALCRRAPAHRAVLLLTCIGSPAIYEIDIGRLRIGYGLGTVKVIGNHRYPVTFLGSDVKSHTMYLTLHNSSDVVSWDLDRSSDVLHFPVVHRGSQCCVRPTSVSVDRSRNNLIILESNIGDLLINSVGTGVFHRLTIVPTIKGVHRVLDLGAPDLVGRAAIL